MPPHATALGTWPFANLTSPYFDPHRDNDAVPQMGAKFDLVADDTRIVKQNLHDEPGLAKFVERALNNSIVAPKTWYFKEVGLVLFRWERGAVTWQSSHFPVQTIPTMADYGNIPLTERSLESYAEDMQQFGIGCKFSPDEVRGITGQQGLTNLMAKVSLQLESCVAETIGWMVMICFVQQPDAIRAAARSENMIFTRMRPIDYFTWRMKMYGSASRGNGGLTICMQEIDQTHEDLKMPQMTDVILHKKTAMLLPQDNRLDMEGGAEGRANFQAGSMRPFSVGGKTVRQGDTFRVAATNRVENPLATISRTGVFHNCQPRGRKALDRRNWTGFQIYDEGADAFVFISIQDCIANSLWWNSEGDPSDALLDLVNRINLEHGFSAPSGPYTEETYRRHVHRMEETYHREAELPAPEVTRRMAHNQQDDDARPYFGSGPSSKVVSTSPDPMIHVQIDHEGRVRARVCQHIADIDPVYLSNDDIYNAAARIVQNDAGRHHAPLHEFAELRADELISVPFASTDTPTTHFNAAFTTARKYAGGVVFQNKAGRFAVGVKGASHAGYVELKLNNNGTRFTNLKPIKKARASARASSDVVDSAGADQSTVTASEGTSSATMMSLGPTTTKGSKSRSKVTTTTSRSEDVFQTTSIPVSAKTYSQYGDEDEYPELEFEHVEEVHHVLQARRRNIEEMYGGNPDILNAANLWLGQPISTRDAHLRLYNNGDPYPFRYKLNRDDCRRETTAAVLYTQQCGVTLISPAASVSGSDPTDQRVYVSYTWKMIPVIFDPRTVWVAPHVGYLRYLGGKGTKWLRGAEEFIEWQRDPNPQMTRGDMWSLGQGINDPKEGMKAFSLTGEFDLQGYPCQQFDPVNDGKYVGMELVRRAFNLNEFEAARQPRDEYTMHEPFNINMFEGTTYSPEGELWCSGDLSYGGIDYVGVAAVRRAERLDHLATQDIFRQRTSRI